MKKIVCTVLLVVAGLTASAQKSFDTIVREYSGRDGYTVVNISGGLLKLAALIDRSDEDLNMLASTISQITIVSCDDSFKSDNAFFDRVLKEIDRTKYEELMDVNSSDTKMKMFVSAEGDLFTEFLMVVGGDDNALIRIKGRMTQADINRLAADSGKEGTVIYRMR
jgi:hypothetical protein